MGLYTQSSDSKYAFAHADAPELAKQLVQGDGIHWAGDPNLELGMETMEAPKSMWYKPLGRRVRKGEILCRRYAVYEHCTDGSVQRIGHWRLEEFDRILFDIASMRFESPNHESVYDQIDAANAAADKANDEEIVGALVEGEEHRLRLIHDVVEGPNRFRQMPEVNFSSANPDKLLSASDLVVPEKYSDFTPVAKDAVAV